MLYNEEIKYGDAMSRKHFKNMNKSPTGALKLYWNPHFLGASMRDIHL